VITVYTPRGAVPVVKPKGTGETGDDRPAAPYEAATPGVRSSGAGWARLHESKQLAVGYLVLLLAGAAIARFADSIERNNCLHRWQDSNLSARFQWREGCMVDVPGYGWIPEQHFTARLP